MASEHFHGCLWGEQTLDTNDSLVGVVPAKVGLSHNEYCEENYISSKFILRFIGKTFLLN